MDLPSHVLFLPLTRPAINRLGLPQKAWIVLIYFTLVFFLTIGRRRPWYLLVGVPFYIALRMATEWDHNWLHIIRLWAKTKFSGSPTAWVKWGGSALFSMRSLPPDDLKDVPHAL